MRKIAGALDLREGDTVIEIGAGHGELTEILATWNKEQETRDKRIRIIAIEKDPKLAENLRNTFKENTSDL